MSREAEIYALVFRRLVMVDHGWGASSPFQEVYVLDSAALNLEQLHTDSGMSARGQPFDDAVKSTLQASAPDLAPVTFVSTFRDIYEPSRPSPSQARNGGALIALGAVAADPLDAGAATVDAEFYGGHLWVRWMRGHLERADGAWRIASSELLALA